MTSVIHLSKDILSKLGWFSLWKCDQNLTLLSTVVFILSTFTFHFTRQTSEFSKNFSNWNSTCIGKAVSPVGSNQMICSIYGCFKSNTTSFLWKNKPTALKQHARYHNIQVDDSICIQFSTNVKHWVCTMVQTKPKSQLWEKDLCLFRWGSSVSEGISMWLTSSIAACASWSCLTYGQEATWSSNYAALSLCNIGL